MPPANAVPPRRLRPFVPALAAACLWALWALPLPAQQAPAPAVAAAAPPAAAPPAAAGAAEHRWEQVFYGQWEGKEVLLHNSSIFYGKLAFGDLDGDGDDDLLVGKLDGRIDRFENVGSRGAPVWRLVQENLTALATRKEKDEGPALEVIDTGGHAAPALVDIDQDGDLDLFVGTGDGRLMFYRNIGNARLPAFVLVTANFLGEGFGQNLVPIFADTNANRTADLIVGNRAGEVYLLVNQGTQRRAAFCVKFPARDALPDEAPPCRPVPRRLLSVAPESNAAPAMVDWDGDGDPDLFVGKSNGTIAYYENKGTAFEGDWRLAQERFLAIDDGGYAAPAFQDANGDGKPDMLIGSSTNSVSLYTYKDAKGPLDVWKVSGNVLNVQRMGLDLRQVVIASGDLDGDKDLDLLVGDRGGRLVWLENVGTPTAPAWRVKQGHVLAGTLRENLAPCLVDLDGDGDLDLLIGGRDGHIWMMRNVGTAKEPQFTLESTNYAGIDVGNDSVPVAMDIDGDGDPDLFVGNRRGLVIFYRNEGTAKEPDFRLAATRFGEVVVGSDAVPAFFDWDGDGKPDLVVGSRKGDLVLDLNTNDAGSTDFKSWKMTAQPWHVFRTPGYSAPHFADLNGDGRPDLLIGDADGNLQLWYDRGARSGAATEQGQPTAGVPGAPGANVAGEAMSVMQGGTVTAVRPSFQSESGLAALTEPAPGGAPVSAGSEAAMATPEQTGPLQPIFVLATEALGGLKFKGRVRPTFGDLDGDGLADLVVGTAEGKLVYFRNEGSAGVPKYAKVSDNLADFDGGGNPSPLLVDLDEDGLLDLVVGTEGGRLLFYRNTGQKNAPAFTRVEDALANINVGRNAAPAVGLINDDALSDLVVGDFTGHMWLFAREGGAQSLNFKLIDRRFLGVDVGVAATPFLGDIDRDGTPDLLVGSDQGRVSVFVKVKKDAKHPQGWALRADDVFKGLKFPFGTSPRLIDLDGDGDMDLVLGSEKGTLYFFRNDALNPPAGSSQ
jgi:large repetitive protein